MGTPDSQSAQDLPDPLADQLRLYFAESIIPYVQKSASDAALKAVKDYVARSISERENFSKSADQKLAAISNEVKDLKAETASLRKASDALDKKRQEYEAVISEATEAKKEALAKLEAAQAKAASGDPRREPDQREEELAALVSAVKQLVAASETVPAGPAAGADEAAEEQEDESPRQPAGDDPAAEPEQEPSDEEEEIDSEGEEGGRWKFLYFLASTRRNAQDEVVALPAADQDSRGGLDRVRRLWAPVAAGAVLGFILGLALATFFAGAQAPQTPAEELKKAAPAVPTNGGNEIQMGWASVKESLPGSVCAGAGNCETFDAAWAQDVNAQQERVRIVQLLIERITSTGELCGPRVSDMALPPATPTQPALDGIWGPKLQASVKDIGKCLGDSTLASAPAAPTNGQLRAYAEIMLRRLGRGAG